ncbi:hypothetical protein Mesci_0113 [Mesorhizobium ciceri biovar biserrulae WSM1271]|uniref:Uncharacterized protein n=1 Tax=Mesorhizobium ciceri biovar biserrulae (strain HAMBI 2942 / LMG 23838 / WSM1271) TaxID=765698 RepID=E8TMY1_MESCW|nr:hypothetical protein Mesci_0113 [Mesorhizobium ciceri biovar biserrulae WSM1271]
MPASASWCFGWEGFQSLSFMLPQSSSSARYVFNGVRAQIRYLHTENIANLAVRATALDRMVAALN